MMDSLAFLADENFPLDAVVALRTAGFDVSWIMTDSPGVDDITVLAQAQPEDRILLTFDKDFGELAFSRRLSAKSGVVLFRALQGTSRETAEFVRAVIASRQDWQGHFSVVDSRRVRMRRLP